MLPHLRLTPDQIPYHPSPPASRDGHDRHRLRLDSLRFHLHLRPRRLLPRLLWPRRRLSRPSQVGVHPGWWAGVREEATEEGGVRYAAMLVVSPSYCGLRLLHRLLLLDLVSWLNRGECRTEGGRSYALVPVDELSRALTGSAYGNGSKSRFNVHMPINLKPGKNEIALLSMTVGLQNAGPHYEWTGAGLTSVNISRMKNGTIGLSSNNWVYKIGLEGEYYGLFKPDLGNNQKWTQQSEPPKNQPLTWYKVNMDVPYWKGA